MNQKKKNAAAAAVVVKAIPGKTKMIALNSPFAFLDGMRCGKVASPARRETEQLYRAYYL